MKSILFFLIFGFGNLFGSDAMLTPTKYEFVASSIGKGKPYFLEVGAKSCHSCQIMGKMLYVLVQKHPEYNIHFINVSNDRSTAQMLNIRMIPTQIIYDKTGKEVYRNIGVLSEEELLTLLKKYQF